MPVREMQFLNEFPTDFGFWILDLGLQNLYHENLKSYRTLDFAFWTSNRRLRPDMI